MSALEVHVAELIPKGFGISNNFRRHIGCTGDRNLDCKESLFVKHYGISVADMNGRDVNGKDMFRNSIARVLAAFMEWRRDIVVETENGDAAE